MPATPVEVVLNLHLRGGLAEFWQSRDPEVVVEGPRGTGKSRVILERINALSHGNPGLRVAIVRKYQKSLRGSVCRTFDEQVLHNGDGVTFFGGNDHEPAAYRYKNGSLIILGGMDDPEKVKSTEYDLIYVNECTELTEEDWDSLGPLLRHVHGQGHPQQGQPIIAAQRLIGDCNPSNSGHWVNRRCEEGRARRIKTYHKDNPLLYDDDGVMTEYGEKYMARLTRLRGPARERWLEGLWTGVENAIYPTFERSVHIRPIEQGTYFKATIIGEDYGSSHKCAVIALSIDNFNRRWVREGWTMADTDQGYSLNLTVSQFKERYATRRGRGDPNQRYLNDRHGFATAKGSAGSRLHRTDLMQRLFYTHPGGRVPSFEEERTLSISQGPFAEPDSPGFFIVEGTPGSEELATQIEAYHYTLTETPKGVHKDVYRDNDDLIAAVEYANEEWEEGVYSYSNRATSSMPQPTYDSAASPLWTPRNRESYGKVEFPKI